ncbi:hypothetical protein JTB14_001865 [Gonioctena quinquepunctata]|nr:hypothetical protein JTB14_001865 [Gonioctena quinquepunctata]
MKIVHIFLAALAVISPVWSDSEEDLLQDMRLKMIQNYIQENHQMNQIIEKFGEICPGYGNEFVDAFNEVQTCTDSIDETQETMCSTVKNHFAKCSKPLVNIFEKCLPEKSRDLPAFIVQTIVSTSNHICRIDGEHIFELSNPCIRSDSYRLRRCMLKVQSRMQQYTSNMPSKMEVCDFIKSLKVCFKSHLALTCGNQKTREAFMDLYETTIKQCNDEEQFDVELIKVGKDGVPDIQ